MSPPCARFRRLTNDNKLGEPFFAKVGQELQARGFKANTGTIVDATNHHWRTTQPDQERGQGARPRDAPNP